MRRASPIVRSVRLSLAVAGSLFALAAQAQSPPQERSQGFRAGLTVPVATGDQRTLAPSVGFGAQVRLDKMLPGWPFGVAFISSYDQFFRFLDDQNVVLDDGSELVIPQAQAINYSSFMGALTGRGFLGPVMFHAEAGGGLVVGFFHGIAQGTDPEIFERGLFPAVSGGGGVGFTFGKNGVVDLSTRYRVSFLDNKVVSRNGRDVKVFNDVLSTSLTVGYLF
jgi:hypothetical protein